jgi:hypothetical protein
LPFGRAGDFALGPVSSDRRRKADVADGLGVSFGWTVVRTLQSVFFKALKQ